MAIYFYRNIKITRIYGEYNLGFEEFGIRILFNVLDSVAKLHSNFIRVILGEYFFYIYMA